MERMREVSDYLLGFFLFVTAPFVPNCLTEPLHLPAHNLTLYESFLTVLIQLLSVVLLVTRIVKTWNQKDTDDETQT